MSEDLPYDVLSVIAADAASRGFGMRGIGASDFVALLPEEAISMVAEIRRRRLSVCDLDVLRHWRGLLAPSELRDLIERLLAREAGTP